MVDKHDLLHEFPESKAAIHELKMTNKHFSHLFDKYHDKDHEVNRIENGAESANDDYLEVRKKERLKLKDELFHMIKEYENQ